MSGPPFVKTFEIRWADIDQNRHLRHSAYADYGAHVRVSFLAEHGFSMSRLAEIGIGPVLFREELLYFKEIHAEETVSMDFRVGGIADDGSRWRLVHELSRADGETAARITVEGAWLDLARRRLMAPPDELGMLFARLPHTDGFETLKALGRRG